MARGDMKIDTLAVSQEIEILNRKEFEAVAMTVDFDGVTATENGEKVVKAGTPILGSGKVVKSTPWDSAVGILLHDTYEGHPQGAVVKVGYINTARAQENSGLTYDQALTTALNATGCRIAFE